MLTAAKRTTMALSVIEFPSCNPIRRRLSELREGMQANSFLKPTSWSGSLPPQKNCFQDLAGQEAEEESMRRVFNATVLLLSLILSSPAFSQSTNATVSGTIGDATGAVLPGVEVTATNDATGVVTVVLSNEAGAYSFASLLPGVYKVSAALPGFQTRTFTGVQLGNAEKVRLNFTLQVGTQAQSVEVTIAADTLLATSSSSIGEVLSQQRVQDLPMVSNNVLDLYRLMPGIRVNPDGVRDRKSTRLNSSHGYISYAVFCLKKKKTYKTSV